MTDDGHKMNHATARNIFLRAMKKLAIPLCVLYNNEESEGNPTFTAQDPRFQESMSELVTNIYENLDK
jgi:hypothetical protein